MNGNQDTNENAGIDNIAGHWVEDLFPPTYKLSLQEFSHGSTSITTSILGRHGRQLPAETTAGENAEQLFAEVARRVSPLDVDAVKNVYQRVWLMMNADQYAKGRHFVLVFVFAVN